MVCACYRDPRFACYVLATCLLRKKSATVLCGFSALSGQASKHEKSPILRYFDHKIGLFTTAADRHDTTPKYAAFPVYLLATRLLLKIFCTDPAGYMSPVAPDLLDRHDRALAQVSHILGAYVWLFPDIEDMSRDCPLVRSRYRYR